MSIISLVMVDVPLTWKIFPGDAALFLPLLFFMPLILSILSLKDKKNVLAKIIISISIISIIITGVWALYVLALGSAWNN